MGDDNSQNDLTDEQRELLAAAGQCDDAVVTEAAAVERFDDHEELINDAEGTGAPVVVDEEEHAALAARTEKLEALMDTHLTDDRGLKAGTVEAMSFAAKSSEFEDDDGEFSAEALIQSPETGEPGETDTDTDSGIEALSGDEQDEAELLRERVGKFDDRGWEAAAETNREKLAELTGDDSVLDGGDD